MAAYFARRLLLLIPTFIGITMLVFGITRFVPGGPIDQWQMQLQMGTAGEGGASSGNAESSMNIDPKALDGLKKHYHFDWPLPKQYLQFLGPLNLDERGPFGVDPVSTELITWETDMGKDLAENDSVLRLRVTGPADTGEDPLPPTTVSHRVRMPEDGRVTNFLVTRDSTFAEGEPLFEYQPESGGPIETVTCPDIWSKKWSGLMAGDLGKSYKFEVPVTRLVVDRFPISLRFGLTGFLLAYLICIPLGVIKAVKHSGHFDIFSSVLIFVGYSIPGWALGAVLLMLLGGGSFWDIMPLGGVYGEGYEMLSFWGKIKDSVYHMILPVIAYSAGSFAVLTVLMKNSLMDNLGQDYVRTAFAKGLSERRVILVHALRNSLIPICTGLGHALGMLMAGSYLIETVFNIDGIGLLGFKSILSRDYAVVMGVLVINTLLMLIGNILSDVLYVLVDPRIRFS